LFLVSNGPFFSKPPTKVFYRDSLPLRFLAQPGLPHDKPDENTAAAHGKAGHIACLVQTD
jgi:hypothetical protein